MGILIGAVVSFVLNIFYSLLKFLFKLVKDLLFATRLILPVLYIIFCAVLYFTGTDFSGLNFWIAATGFAAVTLYSVYLFIKKFFLKKLYDKKAPEKEKDEDRDFRDKRENFGRRERDYARNRRRLEPAREQRMPERLPEKEYAGDADLFKGQFSYKPKVFRVRQNPNFLMYEYPDRVELFEETENGLKYVRTDYTR